jgi:bleomycin hydrolase
MRNRYFAVAVTALLIFLIGGTAAAQDEREKLPEKTFTPVTQMYTTPVLSQGATGTCWSFSTTSFIESELQRMGRENVDFSEIYTVYKTYQDKADYYIRMHGNSTFSQGAHLYDVVRVIEEYGALPDEAYTGLVKDDTMHNHSEMVRVLKAYVDALLDGRRAPSSKWKNGYANILNAYIGEPPAEFTYNGTEYTPRSYADEFITINPDDYVLFMSFTDQPMWEQGVCYVPDNWMHNDEYWNLPLDDFMRVFDHALRNEFTVVIASDVSEKYFRQGEGYAVLERDLGDEPKMVTPEERQQMWETYETTDDHGMHAVGVATDQDGNVFYLVKNSWGVSPRTGPYEGFIYMGENYMRGKLESYMVHKDGIPADIREKLNIK